MAETRQIYKCMVCGNIVEILHAGEGELSCCGQLMILMESKLEEEGQEKHKPIVEKTSSGVIVTVGSVLHPMESTHYIEWIEVTTEHRVYRKELEPGMEPVAEFFLEAEHLEVRAYCNIHGLWRSR
jgi:superoxide reductase